MKSSPIHTLHLLLIVSVAVFLLIISLNLFTNESASEEWIYTLEWINLLVIPFPLAVTISCIGYFLIVALKGKHGRIIVALCGICCVLFFTIPFLLPDYQLMSWQSQYFLSACWALAFIFAGIWVFILATRSGAILASVLCIAGSLFFGLAAMESVLLVTSQSSDGISILSAASRHAAEEAGVPEYESWVDATCGKRPAPEGTALPAFHRLAAFGKDLFDVKYSFNSRGWRAVPVSGAQPDNDLLLFGCSFTFGIGLEDKETWAWQLAEFLGPDWRVENYAGGGYSANHMLCLLENGLIQQPAGVNRYALFLGIDHHIRRNEFFPDTPHYTLNGHGEAEAGGKQAFVWASLLHLTFNGSQLARETGAFITRMALKNPEKQTALYVAMLKMSAQILKNRYNTRLIVLLWPDLEYLASRLEAEGIEVLYARSLLHEWNTPEDPGYLYRIDRYREAHPNRKAAAELAEGLAAYFRQIAESAPRQRLN